jgi:hypothetical protein
MYVLIRYVPIISISESYILSLLVGHAADKVEKPCPAVIAEGSAEGLLAGNLHSAAHTQVHVLIVDQESF